MSQRRDFVGRFVSEYKEEYCDMLYEHMAKLHSFESFHKLGEKLVSTSTLYKWRNDNPEFNEAYESGKAAALITYEELLNAKTTNKTLTRKDKNGEDEDIVIDVACLMFPLRTRFHKTYGDRNKVDLSSKDGTMAKDNLTYEQRRKIAQHTLDNPE